MSNRPRSDTNANKLKDPGEPGLSGWKVYIDLDTDGTLDSNERSITTDASGNWSFKDLVAGTCKVRVIKKPTFKTTTVSSFSVTLTSGQTKTGLLFGEQKIA